MCYKLSRSPALLHILTGYPAAELAAVGSETGGGERKNGAARQTGHLLRRRRAARRGAAALRTGRHRFDSFPPPSPLTLVSRPA